MKRLMLSASVLVFLLGSGMAWAASDTLKVKTGDKERDEKGAVVRDNIDEVTIKLPGGGEMTFARKEVLDIKYKCLLGDFQQGEQFFNQQKYGHAILKYELARDDKEVSSWAKQYVYRRLAQCHEKVSETQQAVENWNKLKDLIPNGKTRFIREAVEGGVNGYSKLGKWDEAIACVAVLEGMGEEEKLMAQIYRAQIAEKRKMYTEAVTAYKKVVSARNPRPSGEIKAQALAGMARCSVEGGRSSEALDAAKKILAIAKEAPDEALAVAHLVIGESMTRGLPTSAKELGAEGKDSKDKREKVKDAISEMLRAIVQYNGSAWAERRALDRVGFWCLRLHDAAEIGDWNNRAVWMYRTLKAKYPKHPLGKKAAGILEIKLGIK